MLERGVGGVIQQSDSAQQGDDVGKERALDHTQPCAYPSHSLLGYFISLIHYTHYT